MSLLSYNGIVMNAHLLDWHREAVYNGPDYLYTKHVLQTRCYWNPGDTAYVLPAGPNAVNPAGPAPARLFATGPVTDASIRHMLMQPQRQLVYSVGGTEVIRSPRVGAVTDSHNGPIPLACDVRQISGIKTFIVDYTIQTDINECYLFKQTPSVLLSHRYTMEVDTDQDGYSTRIIQGRAIFDTAKLRSLPNVTPDDFRRWLFHPIPTNFTRAKIQIIVHEDGSELNYVLIDRELPMNRVFINGVSRIECFKRVRVVKMSFGLAVAAGLQAGGLAFKQGETVDAIGRGVMATASALIPLKQCLVTCRVWGRRTIGRKRLESVAVNMGTQLLAEAIGAIPRAIAGVDASLTHDVMGKFVEYEGSIVTSLDPLVDAFQGRGFGNILHGGIPDLTPSFPDNDEVRDITTGPGVINPVFGFDPGAEGRIVNGTYFAQLAAAALKDPCGTPPQARDLVANAPHQTPP